MLSVSYRKAFVKIKHFYFYGDDYSNLDENINDCDIAFFHGCNIKPTGGILFSNQKTLIKDLRPSEEEIFSSFGKHLKQYIKKNQKESQCEIIFYHDINLIQNDEILEKCAALYEKMFQDKGIKAKFNKKLAMKYLIQKSLVIAIAKIDECIVGFSAAIYDNNNARLWLAAFDFRSVTLDGQLLSRTHQRLDWELLLWCKHNGVNLFDFGGVNSFTEPNGIAQFKMSFEKENMVEYNNYLVPCSFFCKLAIKVFMINRK